MFRTSPSTTTQKVHVDVTDVNPPTKKGLPVGDLSGVPLETPEKHGPEETFIS